MRKGTWLRPYVVRDSIQAHYLPGHELNAPVQPDERTKCAKRADEIGPGLVYQDWRCPWQASNTCPACVAGLIDEASAECA